MPRQSSFFLWFSWALIAFISTCAAASESKPVDLWARDNLVAWCVVPFDAKARGPEERAGMLARLGFKHFAYDWREKDIPTFGEEIEALKRHGIHLLAWWFPFDADNPLARKTLETFKRHEVHPQLWVSLEAVARIHKQAMPGTAREQERRLRQETDRIHALVKLAEPYGVRIALYNHNGWFGMMDNQLAIIERLQERGIDGVGIVYNFSHARDELHDDSKNFAAIWARIQPYVLAVNITGMRWEGEIVYPSQGDSELAMMKTIQESRWNGAVGVIAEQGGDAEITLKNHLVGLDWLASELKRPGSGGPRPFPSRD